MLLTLCNPTIYRRLGITWYVTIRKSGWGLLKSSTAMPTPTPARRVLPRLRIRIPVVRRGLVTARRASSRGRADRTDLTRPRDRPGHRAAEVLEAITPPTSLTLPVVYLAVPLTAISPTGSKIPHPSMLSFHPILTLQSIFLSFTGPSFVFSLTAIFRWNEKIALPSFDDFWYLRSTIGQSVYLFVYYYPNHIFVFVTRIL